MTLDSGLLNAEHIPLLLDGIIVLVIVEMIGLIAFKSLSGRGMAVREVISFLGAGLCLLVALRVLGDGSFAVFAVAMLGSLVLHVMHIVQRWKEKV